MIILSVSTYTFAETTVQDVIKFDGAVSESQPEEGSFTRVYEGPVTFTHKKHIELYNIGCGKCHHKGPDKPLDDLKLGDKVTKCIVCHSNPGIIRGYAEMGLSDEEKREYYANAMHDRCIGCHKSYNRKTVDTLAPMSCIRCHERKPREDLIRWYK
jgi:hypothetical protein